MVKEIKAVLFDLDGTLFDSVAAGKVRVMEIVRSNGFAIPADVQVRMDGIWGTDGKPVREGAWSKPCIEMLEIIFDLDLSAAEMIHHEMEAYDQMNPLPLICGTAGMLSELKNGRGLPLGILTNRHETNTRAMLAHHGLDNFLEPCLIQARDMWTFRKPDPWAFCNLLHILMKQYRIAADECIYAGDTAGDHHAAIGAGLVSVSVCTGGMTNRRFQAIGQDLSHVIQSIGDLPAWIDWYQDARRRSL